MALKFWHVGLTVENLEKAIEQYEALGLKVVDEFKKEAPQALAVLMVDKSGSGVELWQWLDESHPQVEFIKNHVAFLSDDPAKDVIRLEKLGCKIVIPETAGMVVTYTFMQDPNGAYIEIAQAKEGYGR